MYPDPVKNGVGRASRISFLAPLLVLAAGCLPSAGGATGPTPVPSQCAPETFPNTLPPVDAVVDSAALAGGIRDLLRGSEGERPDGHVLLTLDFDLFGINVRRDVIQHDVTPLIADSVQSLVFAARRELHLEGRPWGVRLRIRLSGDPGFEVERRSYCRPRPLDRDLEWAIRGEAAAGTRYRGGRLQRTVVLRVLVHPSGRVQSARIERGAISGGTQEQELFDFIRRYSFHPATLDGIPVAGELSVPVRVRQ
jgi:TonB family protein